MIITSTMRSQHRVYIAQGGTMNLHEWYLDGRYDPGAAGFVDFFFRTPISRCIGGRWVHLGDVIISGRGFCKKVHPDTQSGDWKYVVTGLDFTGSDSEAFTTFQSESQHQVITWHLDAHYLPQNSKS